MKVSVSSVVLEVYIYPNTSQSVETINTKMSNQSVYLPTCLQSETEEKTSPVLNSEI